MTVRANCVRVCISGLKPSTRYEFSVFGRNRLGLGHHSITITSQTWGKGDSYRL